MQVLYNPIVTEARVPEAPREQQNPANQQGGAVFQRVLENKITESISFSKHASLRLAARNINLSQAQISRVEDGMQMAKEKGIRSSLVMVDDVALVVNIPNRTVITAINGSNQNIFTNIDGAVIV